MGTENFLLIIIASLLGLLQGIVVMYLSSLGKKFTAICERGDEAHATMIKTNELQHAEMLRTFHESVIALEKANQDAHVELWRRLYSHRHTGDTGEVIVPRETLK